VQHLTLINYTGMLLYLEPTLLFCTSRKLYADFKTISLVPLNRPDNVVFRPDAHLSSIIRPNDENFSSGIQFVPRSFELFKFVSV
jgi:hypothetical protein